MPVRLLFSGSGCTFEGIAAGSWEVFGFIEQSPADLVLDRGLADAGPASCSAPSSIRVASCRAYWRWQRRGRAVRLTDRLYGAADRAVHWRGSF